MKKEIPEQISKQWIETNDMRHMMIKLIDKDDFTVKPFMKTKVYATYTLNATNGANINGRPSSGNNTKNVFVHLK